MSYILGKYIYSNGVLRRVNKKERIYDIFTVCRKNKFASCDFFCCIFLLNISIVYCACAWYKYQEGEKGGILNQMERKPLLKRLLSCALAAAVTVNGFIIPTLAEDGSSSSFTKVSNDSVSAKFSNMEKNDGYRNVALS